MRRPLGTTGDGDIPEPQEKSTGQEALSDHRQHFAQRL
jgi:hypothetical protein